MSASHGPALEPRPWMEPAPHQTRQMRWSQAEAVRVLVVEDDPAIRDLVVTILSRQGYQVRAVGTGREGVESVVEAPVHVLVTDYQLPDLDGLSVLEQITRYDPRTVGILVTGHGTIDLAIRAMKAGAADMLTKPFQPNDLVMAVQRVLEVHHLRQENRVLKQAMTRGLKIHSFQLADIDAASPPVRSWADSTSRPKSPEYMRGLAEGERHAREQMGKLRQQETVVAGLVRQLADACASLPERLEAEVVTLAFDIARKVIHTCAETQRELVVAQAKEAIARVGDGKAIRILVHPRDLPLLEEAGRELTAGLDGPVSLKIESDARISPGGCLVQTPTHLVDATVEGQLTRIAEALRYQTANETR